MQKKYLQLLTMMSETSKAYWSSVELGREIGCSSRTVLRYIKELKEKETEGGFRIEVYKGKGFQLKVEDSELFGQLWEKEEDREVSAVLFRLLLEETCKLDDLAEMFHYSRSGMSGIMERVEYELEEQGLRLLSKPYIGFLVHGNEIYIRNYLYLLLEGKNLEESMKVLMMDEKAVEAVRSFIYQELKGKNVGIVDSCELFFLKYLGIQQARIRLHRMIKTDYFADIGNTAHLLQDTAVAEQIALIWQKHTEKKYYNEIENVYLALVYRQAFWQNGIVDMINEKDLRFYQRIVERSFTRIHKNYQINLSKDEILVNGLILHIASNFRRYLLGMEMKNLFYNNVLEIYPTAYYYAMEVAEEISNYTKLSLSKYEISFLGMHFASFLERNLTVRKWRSAIICVSGFGTAQLLESKLMNRYQSIEIIGSFSTEELEREPQDVDFYISTVPLNREKTRGKPWVQMSPILSFSEQLSLEQVINELNNRGSWKKNGVEKHFVCMKKKMEKEELLLDLCRECREEGLISDIEAEGILSREELVSTEIVEEIAMPHGLIEGESFLVFAILPTPVMWGRTKVKVVVLGCFQRGDERMKEELEFLFRLFLNEEIRGKILASENEEELEKCIEGYYGGAYVTEKNVD
ncbi:MAG: PTS sugar transporter subunit IIA [Hespellia sp.]|nr:PTS sugar transporter subunit IIA [Hespellia sp.]